MFRLLTGAAAGWLADAACCTCHGSSAGKAYQGWVVAGPPGRDGRAAPLRLPACLLPGCLRRHARAGSEGRRNAACEECPPSGHSVGHLDGDPVVCGGVVPAQSRQHPTAGEQGSSAASRAGWLGGWQGRRQGGSRNGSAMQLLAKARCCSQPLREESHTHTLQTAVTPPHTAHPTPNSQPTARLPAGSQPAAR